MNTGDEMIDTLFLENKIVKRGEQLEQKPTLKSPGIYEFTIIKKTARTYRITSIIRMGETIGFSVCDGELEKYHFKENSQKQ